MSTAHTGWPVSWLACPFPLLPLAHVCAYDTPKVQHTTLLLCCFPCPAVLIVRVDEVVKIYRERLQGLAHYAAEHNLPEVSESCLC